MQFLCIIFALFYDNNYVSVFSKRVYQSLTYSIHQKAELTNFFNLFFKTKNYESESSQTFQSVG